MYDSGSTAFMLVCTMLVLFMTPGLAFFYGGLARRKNVVNTMLMCFAAIGVVGLVWVLAGWSFAYGGDGSLSWFGGFDQLGLVGLVSAMLSEAASVPADAVYPSLVDVCFQMDCVNEFIQGTAENPCAYCWRYDSVVGSGRAEFVEDVEEKIHALNRLIQHVGGTEETFQFPPQMLAKTCVFRVRALEVSGKHRE